MGLLRILPTGLSLWVHYVKVMLTEECCQGPQGKRSGVPASLQALTITPVNSTFFLQTAHTLVLNFQAWHLLDSPPTLTLLSSEIPPALILGSPSMSFGFRGQAWVWLSPLSSVTSPRPWARPYTVCGVVVRIKCHNSVNVFTVVNTEQTPLTVPPSGASFCCDSWLFLFLPTCAFLSFVFPWDLLCCIFTYVHKCSLTSRADCLIWRAQCRMKIVEAFVKKWLRISRW